MAATCSQRRSRRGPRGEACDPQRQAWRDRSTRRREREPGAGITPTLSTRAQPRYGGEKRSVSSTFSRVDSVRFRAAGFTDDGAWLLGLLAYDLPALVGKCDSPRLRPRGNERRGHEAASCEPGDPRAAAGVEASAPVRGVRRAGYAGVPDVRQTRMQARMAGADARSGSEASCLGRRRASGVLQPMPSSTTDRPRRGAGG